MGLFSDKYETIIATTVSRVIEDDNLPDSILASTIKSIFKDENISENVVESLTTNVAFRADRMYSYAENNYFYGLPSGEIYSSTQGKNEVKSVLETIEGGAVSLLYSRLGPANALHLGWLTLINQYGYNTDTNVLDHFSTLEGKTCYLVDMVPVFPSTLYDSYSTGTTAQWGVSPLALPFPGRPAVSPEEATTLSHSLPIVSNGVTADHVRITYGYSDGLDFEGTPVFGFENVILSLPSAYDNEKEYFQAAYSIGGVKKYWIYELGVGTYPVLDAFLNSPMAVSGVFFPFAYFRFDKTDQSANKTTDAYRTTKRMLKYLSVDFDAVATAIDENPDIADVEQAIMIFAVPANTTNQLEQKYLYSFFENLYLTRDGVNSSVLDLASIVRGVDRYTIKIEDNRFKMLLSDSGISKEVVTGVIGPVGSYASGTVINDVVVNFNVGGDTETQSKTLQVSYHEYRKQVSATEYEQIRVVDMKMRYFVLGSNSTTADETDNILLIPLDKTIVAGYETREKELIYSRSLHYVFNSVQIIKIKWYQTGIFQVFTVLVSIAIAFYDGGATLGAVLGVQGTAAIIATIVVNLIIGEVLKVAFKLFAKVFGEEFAMLVAIVALVTAGYQVFQSGSLQGAPWAQDLLMLANGLSTAALEIGYEGLMTEQSDFLAFMEQQNKLLETANELLENKTALNPFVIFGESPTDYYNRTVHSGNIGVFGIEAVAQYTEIALTLPKLNDTLGDVL